MLELVAFCNLIPIFCFSPHRDFRAGRIGRSFRARLRLFGIEKLSVCKFIVYHTGKLFKFYILNLVTYSKKVKFIKLSAAKNIFGSPSKTRTRRHYSHQIIIKKTFTFNANRHSFRSVACESRSKAHIGEKA